VFLHLLHRFDQASQIHIGMYIYINLFIVYEKRKKIQLKRFNDWCKKHEKKKHKNCYANQTRLDIHFKQKWEKSKIRKTSAPLILVVNTYPSTIGWCHRICTIVARLVGRHELMAAIGQLGTFLSSGQRWLIGRSGYEKKTNKITILMPTVNQVEMRHCPNSQKYTTKRPTQTQAQNIL
jgi:hypothetical protein